MQFDRHWILYGIMVLVILGVTEGLYLLVSDLRSNRRAIARRLSQPVANLDPSSGSGLRRKPDQAATAWLRQFLNTAVVQSFDNMVATSGIAIATHRLVLGMGAGFAVIFLLIDAFRDNALEALALAIACAVGLPIWLIRRVRRRRLKKLADQLPNTLDTLVRSLRAGHPIPASIDLVGREMPDPIGAEFAFVHDEMAYGMDLRQALERMVRRLRVPEIDYMVVAIRIQSETGGNLGEILGSLASVVREQQKLQAKVRAISSESVFAAKVLGVLPICVWGALMFLNPQYYAGAFKDPTLTAAIAGAGILIIAGWLMLRVIVNIKV